VELSVALMSGFSISAPDPRRFKFLRIYCEVSAIAVVALGCVVLCAWAFQWAELNSIFPGLVAVSVNMALLLVFAGSSLGLLLPGTAGTPTRNFARFLALMVMMAGAVTRMEYFFNVHTGIERFLFKEPAGMVAAAYPGRMSPTSATAFLTLGMALVFLEWETKKGKRRPSQGLALWTALVGLVAIICYTYRATALNKFWLYTQIALPMAIALFVLGLAIFFARPRSGIAGDITGEGSGSAMARRFLPAVLFIPLLLGWICLHGEQAKLFGVALGLSIFTASNVAVFGFLVWLNARKMNAEFAQRSAAEAEIRALNADLEHRVAERTEALRNSEAHLSYSAQHDFLTGLPNRMLLNDRANQAIVYAPRLNKKVSVLFLDLDGFKHINDSLGHPIGDKLLQSIAKRLVKCVRATDTVSRQGGDEFVVLLSEMANSEDAAITARRMLQEIAEAHSVDEHDLHVTASIGISVYPDDGMDAETLIKNADTAMYQAKENGRQNYQFFKPAMNVRAVARQSIEESLRRALGGQEFTLLFQPKVNLKSGDITGAEALLRWTHPTRGPISPAKFVPVAEDSGLIVAIDKWVLREACIRARGWADAGLPQITVGVNVSAMEFRNEKFLEGIFGILKETGLDPRFLELELTESVLMKRPASTESILKTLRARGVQLAVDDFGTGYSSLNYLRKFSVDSLKIDQSFVRQITTAPEESSIVTAMINMGRSLNLRVVAEGVETREELAFLQERECDEAQGFYFSRAVNSEEFAKLLATGIPEPIAAGR
jgi:diguanylate cyclase (GGDEF)-like protein